MATASVPLTYSADTFEWTLLHIQKFGDTDFLPIPVEYESIRRQWQRLLPTLTAIDFLSHKPKPPRRFLVSKPGNGFRVVHQLDPIDAILYTACVYNVAAAIEAYRLPMDRKIACAYRISPDTKGSFFPQDDGWTDYHKKSLELVGDEKVTYVVVADIADFYNQIYLHRVETALESAGIDETRANAIEQFLLTLGGANQSQGIPVGPAASIILAESVLSEIDSLLVKHGYKHVRYVDDFRIFCNSKPAAYKSLHLLTEYLYTIHRLSLQSMKSRVIPKAEFLANESRDPHEDEDKKKKSRIEELLENFREIAGYNITEDDLGPDHLNAAVRESIIELFKAAVESTPIHLGLVRYLLRRARELRTAGILPLVVSRLGKLSPVIRDAARYLQVVLTPKNSADHGIRLVQFAKEHAIGQTPFVQYWVLWLLAQRPHLCPSDEAFRLGESAQATLGLRPLTLVMKAHNQIDWIRGQKENIGALSPWDRRPLIDACRLLPSSERKATLAPFREGSDVLDSIIAIDATAGLPGK